jgi:hypothetical protein
MYEGTLMGHQSFYILAEIVRTAVIILILGLCGAAPLMVFRSTIRFIAVAAPFSGLLLVNALTLGSYFILHISFASAAIFALSIGLITFLVSMWFFRLRTPSFDVIGSVILFLLISILYLFLNDAASLWSGLPKVMYFDGTDHMGYANVAQWMRDHIAWPSIGTRYLDRPRADPMVPYESMPNIMLNAEPRNGAFGFLALIAFLFHVPTAFAHDKACAIVLSCSLPGAAAVFSKRWSTLLLLLLGLMSSSLYDFSHAGYLGKLLAYPSILLWIGLFFAGKGINTNAVTLVLALYAAASAILLSGIVTGAAIFLFGAVAILLSRNRGQKFDVEALSRLVLCAFVAVAAGGFLIHPVSGWSFGMTYFDSMFAGPRALDLEGWVASAGLTPQWLTVFLIAAITIPTVLGFASLRYRTPASASLLMTAVVIFLGLSLFTARTELLQTTGLLYPAILCGVTLLLEDVGFLTSRYGMVVVASLVFMIGLRIPRLFAATARYTSPIAVNASFSKAEVDNMVATIGSRVALVDLGDHPCESIFLMVEFGRRPLSIQWSANAWRYIVGGWRPWSAPKYENVPDLEVVLTGSAEADRAIFVGPHFAVIDFEHKDSKK